MAYWQEIAEHRRQQALNPGKKLEPLTRKPESIIDILNERDAQNHRVTKSVNDAQNGQQLENYDLLQEQRRVAQGEQENQNRIAKYRQDQRERQARIDALVSE